MSKSLAFLLVLLLASSGLHARPAGADAPPVPLLWKACDADNCLYLLGAFHVLKESDYPLSGDVDAAFADAEQLVFEIPPQELDSPGLQQQMMLAAIRRDGSQLRDELDAAQNARLDAWLDGNASALSRQGIAPAMFQVFKPWFAALLISMTDMQQMGMQPELGLDRHFMVRANAAGKPVSGLETGAGQVALLAGMTPGEQREMLDDALDAHASGGVESRRLHEAWRRGDVDAMISGSIIEMKREHPRLYQVINVDRNDAWLPQLERRLKAAGTDDHLVVVGAMHLLGADGVVEKLRAKGYAVSRICSACGITTGK